MNRRERRKNGVVKSNIKILDIPKPIVGIENGDLVTIAGLKMLKNGDVITNCERGQETTFRVNYE